MTREEAHEELPKVDSYMQWGTIHDVIDNIYDDFEIEKTNAFHKGVKNGNEAMKVAYENRKCENCKNCKMTEGGYNCTLPYHKCYVELDFGCNKWESK